MDYIIGLDSPSSVPSSPSSPSSPSTSLSLSFDIFDCGFGHCLPWVALPDAGPTSSVFAEREPSSVFCSIRDLILPGYLDRSASDDDPDPEDIAYSEREFDTDDEHSNERARDCDSRPGDGTDSIEAEYEESDSYPADQSQGQDRNLTHALKQLALNYVRTKVIGSSRIVYDPRVVPDRFDRRAPKMPTENDVFDRNVNNGASYRTCQDTPFQEILNIPWYGNRRPPHPYSHLIALALLSAAPSDHVLKIEDLYLFIAWRFPYFSLKDSSNQTAKRWKSAVRHNLSFSCSFKKVDAGNIHLPGGTKRCLWGFSDRAWQAQLLLIGHHGQRKRGKHCR